MTEDRELFVCINHRHGIDECQSMVAIRSITCIERADHRYGNIGAFKGLYRVGVSEYRDGHFDLMVNVQEAKRLVTMLGSRIAGSVMIPNNKAVGLPE